MVIRIKKRKKAKRIHGSNSYGRGARGKGRKSGEHGGGGMSGSGKKADHKKSLVIKLHGNKYFGKQGITSKSTKRDKSKQINLARIQDNFDSLMKKYGKDNVLILKGFKVLGEGELKEKITIKAYAFTKSAKEKIEKIGGTPLLEKEPKKKVEKNVEEKKDSKPKEKVKKDIKPELKKDSK
jgi:large subunit ribosomal protein L15